jgi:hypothetical protein
MKPLPEMKPLPVMKPLPEMNPLPWSSQSPLPSPLSPLPQSEEMRGGGVEEGDGEVEIVGVTVGGATEDVDGTGRVTVVGGVTGQHIPW